jgi:uncharacterized phiE125 gp8 family phage protein
MPLRLITPPAALAVSLDTARAAARLDGTDDDAQLEQAVRTYTDEAEHITGRAFVGQTWALTLDAFPDEIELPKPPLVSVVHIKYYDADGAQQTLDPSAYQVDTSAEPGLILPAIGTKWPQTCVRKNAVEVQFTCGYGATDASVPDGIKGYVLAKVQEHFAAPDTPKNENLIRLLDRYKVYS